MNVDLPESRFVKIGDAASQFLNVLILPNHADTTPNESISGRCHRCGWTRAEAAIDLLCWWDKGPNGEGHCELAYKRDIKRAMILVAKYKTELETQHGR